MRRVFAVIALIGFFACAVPYGGPPRPRHAQFEPAEYEPFKKPGSGSISGQAFLKTRGGDVKYGAGDPVHLNPVTTYSTEWWDRCVLGTENLEKSDSRAEATYKCATADGSGNFRFDHLPPGDYYVACWITWEAPTGFGLTRTGGVAHGRVSVKEGEESRVVITIPVNETPPKPTEERKKDDSTP